MAAGFIGDLRERIRNTLAPALAKAQARVAPQTARVRAWYQGLQPRERVLVRIAGTIVAVLFLYLFVYSPILDLTSGLDDSVAARSADLAQVRQLVSTYTSLKANVAAAEHNTVPNARDFSLFSVVEASLTKTVGHDKIASITPSPDQKLPGGLTQFSVQLKLSNVNLDQIVEALYGVRTLGVPVAVSSLRIERHTDDTHTFDVDMICIALAHSA